MFFGDLAGTGFGTVTMDLGRELLALGHDVRFVSQNDVGTLPEPFASRTFDVGKALLDGQREMTFGASSLALPNPAGLLDGSLWEDGWVAETAIVLGDFTGVRLVVMADDATRDAFAKVPTFHYVPVEGIDLPPRWAETWRVVRPVAMSEFGADQIERILGTRPPVIYHGVDTTDFWPVSPVKPLYIGKAKLRSKAQAKRFFGGDPHSRWLFRADRHMPRKRYASLIRSLVPVLASRPDVYLVLHCLTMDQGGDLRDTLSKVPQAVQPRILRTGFHDQLGGASREVLAALYNAADVYVSTSAEGFGLTIAEAMACGTPAVGIDYSAVPEVIGAGGRVVAAPLPIDNEYDHFWAGVDEVAFGRTVGALLDDDLTRAQMGKAAAERVRALFRWDIAAQQFSALFVEALA